MFLIFKLLLYFSTKETNRGGRAERWKIIERVREESRFYLFHFKRREVRLTFRTIVNFDKAQNDLNHVLHRHIKKKNERLSISASPTTNSAWWILRQKLSTERSTMFWNWSHYIAIHWSSHDDTCIRSDIYSI